MAKHILLILSLFFYWPLNFEIYQIICVVYGHNSYNSPIKMSSFSARSFLCVGWKWMRHVNWKNKNWERILDSNSIFAFTFNLQPFKIVYAQQYLHAQYSRISNEQIKLSINGRNKQHKLIVAVFFSFSTLKSINILFLAS